MTKLFINTRKETTIPIGKKCAEFDAFLRGPSSVTMSSHGLNWSGFAIERHAGEGREVPETISENHIIAHWRGGPAICEHRDRRGNYVSFRKVPGSVTLIPVGLVPAVRTREAFDVVLCALEPDFVNRVKEEVERQPSTQFQYLKKHDDEIVPQLMTLLAAEAHDGGPSGRLYADHLAHALALRFLHQGARGTLAPRHQSSALPRHLLQRVFERMREFNSNVTLEMLAKEVGYSRTHFLNMFKTATGCTPYHYLLRLRVERAQELIRYNSLPLIDVAAHCGFSSHAHMSRVFRQFLGITPSEYRRNL